MEKNNFRKIATITLFESAVQWYCFLLYGTAAGTVFNKVFFSQTGNGTTALILSYMSFAPPASKAPVLQTEPPPVLFPGIFLSSDCEAHEPDAQCFVR